MKESLIDNLKERRGHLIYRMGSLFDNLKERVLLSCKMGSSSKLKGRTEHLIDMRGSLFDNLKETRELLV